MIRAHRSDDTVTCTVERILRADLVIDDTACCPSQTPPPKDPTGSSTPACEKRSIAISSNLYPGAFDELMPKTPATATVDRLRHHAHSAGPRATPRASRGPSPGPVMSYNLPRCLWDLRPLGNVLLIDDLSRHGVDHRVIQ